MHRNKLARWILAAAMAVAAVPGMAQSDEGPILLPKKPIVKPDSFLLVMCDLACNWKLDGAAKGRIEAGGSVKVKVELGQHMVVATTLDGADQAQKIGEVKSGGQTVVSLTLQPVRDARIRAEKKAQEEKAKPASAALLVLCDLACNWKLDGVAKGRIEGGGSARATVDVGQHLVFATTEDGADQAQQRSEVKAGGQTVVSLELKPVRAARLKAAQGATLLVICDLACNWKLDGEAKGRIGAGGSARATVDVGQHLVLATTEDGADQAQQRSEVTAGGQTVVSLALQPVRNARLKAEQEAAMRAAGGTLLVYCDLACNWKLDGVAQGRIEVGGTAKATVNVGQHVVDAATEDGADQIEERSEAIAGGQTLVSIALKPLRDARLKALHNEEMARLHPSTPVYSSDPSAPHPPGIYMATGAGADRRMVRVEPHEFATKIVDFIVRVQMDGSEAKIKADAQPEFYIYFDERGAGSNPASLGAAYAPTDFMLLRFAPNDEGKLEASIAKMGFTKFQGFNRDKISFFSTKVGPAAYKISVNSPLSPGEYGFLSLSLATIEADFTHTSSSKDKAPSRLFGFEVP